MANFFNEIAGGAEKMQAQFLGPTYNYAKNIKSPNEVSLCVSVIEHEENLSYR